VALSNNDHIAFCWKAASIYVQLNRRNWKSTRNFDSTYSGFWPKKHHLDVLAFLGTRWAEHVVDAHAQWKELFALPLWREAVLRWTLCQRVRHSHVPCAVQLPQQITSLNHVTTASRFHLHHHRQQQQRRRLSAVMNRLRMNVKKKNQITCSEYYLENIYKDMDPEQGANASPISPAMDFAHFTVLL